MKYLYTLLSIFLVYASLQAQTIRPLRWELNEEGTQWVRLTAMNQVWLRHTEMNYGTGINGVETDRFTDISIRRLRFSLQSKLTEKIYFYSQFGINNFNHLSTKFQGAFFHDAIVEYQVSDNNSFHIGGGLTGWSGLSRYSTPSIGTLLALDAPLYQQFNASITDQFLRNLAIYVKGQIGALDYRLAYASPLDPPPGTTFGGSDQSYFNPNTKNPKLLGYAKYMFWDLESNVNPYQVGSYLGTKKVLNLGAGFAYQKDGMQYFQSIFAQPQLQDMFLWAADLFYENPISEESTISAYLAYTNYNFGPNHITMVGVSNPANGFVSGDGLGFGNSLPLRGTGSSIYGQLAWLTGKDFISEKGKFQPFGTLLFSNYERLNEPAVTWELGANYLVHGTHQAKFSLMYQNRPMYNDSFDKVDRGDMFVLQYQLSF